jgi:hypothetical protein
VLYYVPNYVDLSSVISVLCCSGMQLAFIRKFHSDCYFIGCGSKFLE